MSTETEKFVKALNELRMTPEERQIKKAEELGKQFGEVFAGIIILFAYSHNHLGSSHLYLCSEYCMGEGLWCLFSV
jgi:hypothetical protein